MLLDEPHGSEVTLAPEEWRRAEATHIARAENLTQAHRARAARGERHPVEDFLFTYYGYKPAVLRRWHPGAGVRLQDAGDEPRARWRGYRTEGKDVVVDVAAFSAHNERLRGGIARLLRATAERPGSFGCFGLHEWAMVYRVDQPRHRVPLRLGHAGTDAVVESHELQCTHIDAFRFFTPEAAARNRATPTREEQHLFEQPGCLHANMDLYKWAIKLGPLVPGEVLLDAFALARDIRTLDMRASPYDLSAWGYEAVAIETPEGKLSYGRAQRSFAQRAEVIRSRLIEVCTSAAQPAVAR